MPGEEEKKEFEQRCGCRVYIRISLCASSNFLCKGAPFATRTQYENVFFSLRPPHIRYRIIEKSENF